jgi:hypothetical protein
MDHSDSWAGIFSPPADAHSPRREWLWWLAAKDDISRSLSPQPAVSKGENLTCDFVPYLRQNLVPHYAMVSPRGGRVGRVERKL